MANIILIISATLIILLINLDKIKLSYISAPQPEFKISYSLFELSFRGRVKRKRKRKIPSPTSLLRITRAVLNSAKYIARRSEVELSLSLSNKKPKDEMNGALFWGLFSSFYFSIIAILKENSKKLTILDGDVKISNSLYTSVSFRLYHIFAAIFVFLFNILRKSRRLQNG